MFPQTLYPKTKQVLDKLSEHDFLSDFYLAGGTGLALQLGHRKSIDLDFFAQKPFDRDILLQNLSAFSPTITQEAPGTIDCIIDTVKVSFLLYTYPLISNMSQFEKVSVASINDIACMKLSAISSRGAKKDFIDLYVILESGFTLTALFEMFEQKFTGVSYNRMHILKSLVYFDDATNDPEPEYLSTFLVEWKSVINRLQNEVTKLL
ncbi:hypothetical protein COY32_01715 [candidate division WWE3 bacterium CG_4_10_14_0_2_um_filter_41_14]|uniref:Nucleotidyl transferase AbiEii/AbiGii toxin family protein n=1 Tax=candidate division WWE3 bacterium CG_4_10_14_0_2_um_filter_41_14 TaxID=1975072 RepID=A0A2M7TKN1_UNCKA|nr:MAG: hypothetical protein COY32_01715 [candidate division WWE3 bacterium CG_4_10_14_0_2_um_filter_41_14]